jgi:hypothetical protein
MEKHIEKYLVTQVKRHCGWCLKWISPSQAGVPDRIVILPGGKIFFVELKNADGKLSAIQQVVTKRLKKLGCEVMVINSKNGVDEFLRKVGK